MSMSQYKKIAFFGTPAFTVDFLEVLKAHELTPSLIVTNPDKPVGRGMQITSPLPKVWAEKNGITVLQPEKLDGNFFETLSKESWDLFVVIAYGKIIPERIITLPTHGTINVHYSLLPKYRGATPVESAILEGDEVTGVSIQQMVFALDAGDVIASQEISILDTDTTPVLRDKLNEVAVTLLPKTIQAIFEGTIQPTPQDESQVSHYGKLKKEDGELILAGNDLENWRKYKAYEGSIGTYFYMDRNGKKVRTKITKARFENGKFIIEEIIPENGKKQKYQ